MNLNSSVARFNDPLPFQTAIRAGQFEVLPTVGGKFRSELIRADFSSVWMQRAWESLPRIYRGTINPGRVVIAFMVTGDRSPTRFCGMELGEDEIVFSNSELLHFSTSSSSSWGSMSLTPESLAIASEAIAGREIPAPAIAKLLRPAPVVVQRLRAVHRAAAELARNAPSILARPDVARAFESQLTEIMVRSLNLGEPKRVTASNLRHRSIIARFEEFLQVRQEQPVYLLEICKAIGVSERTLRAACQDQFGIAPTRYLWLRRMYLARRSLAAAVPKTATVTEVAMSNGFWELGRFASAYRSLFGESPSITLRRPPDDEWAFERHRFDAVRAGL